MKGAIPPRFHGCESRAGPCNREPLTLAKGRAYSQTKGQRRESAAYAIRTMMMMMSSRAPSPMYIAPPSLGIDRSYPADLGGNGALVSLGLG